MKPFSPSASPLARAIALTLVALPASTFATVVPGGQTVVVDGATQPPGSGDTWTVAGRLDIINGGRARQVAAGQGEVNLDGAILSGSNIVQTLRSANGAVVNVSNSSVTNTLARGIGLVLANDGGMPGFGTGGVARITNGSSITGGRYGMTVGANGDASVDASSIVSTAAGSDGAQLLDGRIALTNGARVTGQANGLAVTANVTLGQTDHGRALSVDGSTIQGLGGSAISLINTDGGPSTTLALDVTNGSSLIGSDNVIVRLGDQTSVQMGVGASNLTGDIVMADTSTASVALHDNASWTGRVNGAATVGVASGGSWHVTGDSVISALDVSGGQVGFAPANTMPSTLTVQGDLTGTGGTLALNTVANAGGPLVDQVTDRLLIKGNVATTGTTLIDVNLTGAGALTDIDRDGTVSPFEGISIVQVGGSSRADAFALRSGYVAVNAFQYTLHAFGPGGAGVDASQNALGAGTQLTWDYRLANRYVCETDCTPVEPPVEPPVGPTDPENPEGPGPTDPGTPGEPDVPALPDPGNAGENSRAAVVPQVPSYLSAPAALLTYGDILTDGLHQRLGDIRNGRAYGAVGGELFARYVGGQYRYNSNRSFQQYGYDFDQQVNALQVGGNVLAIVGEASTLRAGWALDHGTTRITPKAADGESHAKYDANGVSAWLTWQADNGFYVDGVLGNTRYDGNIGTSMRGEDVARIHANAWHASVEAGMPFAIADGWSLEPQVQVRHQALTFRDFRDADDLDVRLGTVRQTTTRVGAMLTRTATAQFMPYARLDLSHTGNGEASAHVSSEAFNASSQFAGGRVGNAWRGALGAVAQLTPHVQLYGEGNYQHFVGNYGMQGWTANAGVRVTF